MSPQHLDAGWGAAAVRAVGGPSQGRGTAGTASQGGVARLSPQVRGSHRAFHSCHTPAPSSYRGGPLHPRHRAEGKPRWLMPSASPELPGKQEQLTAIYAVLEHLPEANHNALERLVFHLVKQVPPPPPPPRRHLPTSAPEASTPGSLACWPAPGSGRGPSPPGFGTPGVLYAAPLVSPTSGLLSWKLPRAPGTSLCGSQLLPNCQWPCRVALLEDVNRMSPGALAIIFAPCLLRCPDNSDPLTSMKDVLKITA